MNPGLTSGLTPGFAPGFLVKGRCPGAIEPMASGDGLVVRVRPPLGRLSRAQALGLAQLAQQYGSGALELSTRANVQLRGVQEAQHGALLTALAALGLLDANAWHERLRAIVIDPLWQAGDGVQPAALALQQALQQAQGLESLPAKFGWAVGHCKRPALAAASADLRLWCDGPARWWLQPDGQGQALSCPTLEAAIAATVTLTGWGAQQAHARRAQGRHPGRMADMWTQAPQEALAGPWPPGCTWQACPVSPPSGNGPDPAPGLHDGLGALLAAPLGRIAARDWAALAQSLAPEAGLRITPWRAVVAEGVHVAPSIPGWIAQADTPLLRAWACSGAPGCDQAIAPALPLAAQLAPLLPPGALLHVSGCAKGCARQQAADFTLYAQTQADGLPAFAIVRQGGVKDRPSGHIPAAALEADPHLLFAL